MMKDAEILNKLKQGRQSALTAAIERYTPYISTVIFNMAGARLTKEDAEEIASDAFCALWKNAARMNPEKGGVKNYLAGICRNLTAMKMRGRCAETLPIDDVEIPSADTPAESVIKNDRAEYLWRQVMSLGEPDSEIFVRYYEYGEKIKTIAAALNIKSSTVKSKLMRGKAKLKKRLSDTEGLL